MIKEKRKMSVIIWTIDSPKQKKYKLYHTKLFRHGSTLEEEMFTRILEYISGLTKKQIKMVVVTSKSNLGGGDFLQYGSGIVYIDNRKYLRKLVKELRRHFKQAKKMNNG